MKLAIYGAGGLGREVLELAQEINATESRWDALCLVDDNPQFDQLNSYPIVPLNALIPSDRGPLRAGFGWPRLSIPVRA